jgi:N-methylhydantoinase A
MLPGEAIENLAANFADLEQLGAAEFNAEGLFGVPQRTLDLRYRRQGYELNVNYDPSAPAQSIEAFHRQHLQRYGFCDRERPIEIVNLRLRMTAAAEPYTPPRRELVAGNGSAACYAERDVFFDGSPRPARFYHREQLTSGDAIPGPAMITEYTAATLLPPNSHAVIDGYGNIVITVSEEASA